MEPGKKRYAVVGTGGRSVMFLHPIAERFRDSAVLVAFCDPSPTRMQFHIDSLRTKFGYEEPIAQYGAEDFDLMIKEQNPDCVIVCSVDATHAEYIIRSVRAGCDVIAEKPIATTAEQCREIQAAIKETGRSVRVTFNYRWSPGVTRVWELLRENIIGQIQNVNLEYLLDTQHGADYFRRWHSNMANSGGLLVHKSTHHFDLVNWWLDSLPETVFAQGKLAFYGRQNALKRGDEALTRYERYTGEAPSSDPFKIDLTEDENAKALYYVAEKDNGYKRDLNVFRDGIDIYDTMSVLATYRNRVFLNYSLVAFCPLEGFRVTFAGDRGRIEYNETHSSHLILGQSDEELSAEQNNLIEGRKRYNLEVFPHFSKPYKVEIQEAAGGHGGGDPLIQEQMFASHPPAETKNRNAGWEQGIASAMLGICANHSIESGSPCRVSDLFPLREGVSRLSELA